MTRPSAVAGKQILVEPVLAYRGAVPEAMRDLEISNPFYTFWTIERGGVRLDWKSGHCRVAASRSVLIPAGLRRRHRFPDDARIVSLSFRAVWSDGRPLLVFPTPLVFPSELLGKAAVRVVSARRGGKSPPAADALAFNGRLSLFVAEVIARVRGIRVMSEGGGPNDRRLARILEDLVGNLRAGALPFERWHRETGLSRVHIERLARLELGTTLRRYRDELLLAEVRRSLASGRESLKETAGRLGFFDGAHFTRWVAAHAGCNPSDLLGVGV